MDRDLGTPKTSQISTGISAGLGRVPAGLPMKQIRQRLPGTRLQKRLRPMRLAIAARTTRSFTGEHSRYDGRNGPYQTPGRSGDGDQSCNEEGPKTKPSAKMAKVAAKPSAVTVAPKKTAVKKGAPKASSAKAASKKTGAAKAASKKVAPPKAAAKKVASKASAAKAASKKTGATKMAVKAAAKKKAAPPKAAARKVAPEASAAKAAPKKAVSRAAAPKNSVARKATSNPVAKAPVVTKAVTRKTAKKAVGKKPGRKVKMMASAQAVETTTGASSDT